MFGEDVSDHQWPEAVGPMGPYGGYGPTIMAIAWAEFALATLLVVLRIFTRYFIQKNAGWALSWTGISWLFGFISQTIFTVAVYNSMNGFDNSWTVPHALTLTWVSIYFTFLGIGLGKFAVVAFILSLQGMTHIKQRYFLYFLAVSNILIDLIFVFFLAFRCSPPSKMFILGLSQTCGYNFEGARGFGYFTGSWNAATDLILAVYPLYLFHNIAIARHVKFGICFVMSLSVVTSAVSIVKTWDIQFINDTDHLSYELYCILTWSFTELWCVIITCSIPPLWPLAKRMVIHSRASFQSAKSWAGSSSGNQSGQSGSGWTRRASRNTLLLLGQGATSSSTSRRLDRSRSIEKDVELLKHPQAQPSSRAIADRGCDSALSVHESNERRSHSHTRKQSSKSNFLSKSQIDSQVSAKDDADDYEIYEPERGIMFSRDLARPGIVVTREMTVETERRREERRGGDWTTGDFGHGQPMRHSWGDPEDV